MKAKQQGFLFVTALVFLLLFSWMSVLAVHESQMNLHLSKNFKEMQQLLFFSEEALQKIERELAQGSPSSQGQFTIQKNVEVVFHTESLSVDPCTEVNNHKKMQANYYRIRMTLKNTLLDIPLSLETTEVLPVIQVNAPYPCERAIRKVSAGRQSWRLL